MSALDIKLQSPTSVNRINVKLLQNLVILFAIGGSNINYFPSNREFKGFQNSESHINIYAIEESCRFFLNAKLVNSYFFHCFYENYYYEEDLFFIIFRNRGQTKKIL